ncbi:MAG: MerR family transcriptional regulator [Bryobacterales bacterium]|nr:MerR family transcriptional regulator [Bryobacterales bacterium]MEB2360881.1 MerR family transcriptional regulator [Bryobacterales bacterium]
MGADLPFSHHTEDDATQRLSIGDLAKATGVKVVTIRYYEQAGLMPSPPRTEGNCRAYSQEHLHRLRFIRRCRDLGFTLDQVRDLLRMSSEKNQACVEVDRLTSQHLTAIERRSSISSGLRPSCAV